MNGRTTTAGSDYAIDVNELSVRYNLRLSRKNTLRQSVNQMFRRGEGDRTFWALRRVSFRLVHGESLAVIGPNGAGKSTLLQVLAGILTPSEGSVDVRGHISSLLQLGAGFDQELNGRDNIALAGAFMGIPHDEMVKRAPGIIDFADIGQFIDAPLKTYSSGMRARLGFALATSVDPDVLLLDEVLSTGDQVFREKSRNRVLELARSARAIVLVTHDMNWVTEFCNRAMLLEKGQVAAEGEPEDIVRVHQDHSLRERARKEAEEIHRLGDSTGFSQATIELQERVRRAIADGQIQASVDGIQEFLIREYIAADPTLSPALAGPAPVEPSLQAARLEAPAAEQGSGAATGSVGG